MDRYTPMDRGQPFQSNFYASHNQPGGDAISTDHVASSLGADGMGPRLPALHRPASSDTPRFSPSSAARSLYVYSTRRDEVTPLEPPPSFSSPPAVPHPHYLLTEVQNQGEGLGYQHAPFNSFTLRPYAVAGPPQGPPCVIPPQEAEGNSNTHVFEYQRSNLEGSTFRSLDPSFPLDRSPSGWAGDAASSSNNRAFASGGGRSQGQFQTTNGPIRLVPSSLNVRNDRPAFYLTVDHTASIFAWPHGGERGGRYKPYSGARPNHQQIQSPGPPASFRQSDGEIDLPYYPAPPHPHSFGDERVGNEVRLEAVLPGSRSSRTPSSQPTGVRRSGNSGEPRKTASHAEKTLSGELKPRKSRKKFNAFVAKLLEDSVGICGPTRLVSVPITLYQCPHSQEAWEKCAPIKFWNIKLTDAANGKYASLQGADDEVFNYNGVGSSISCRLKVAGRDIGTSKIPTMNSKSPPKYITKKKLAFKVAEFVWNFIEEIQEGPGCANITFQNLVLVELVRVAKASWQPVFCYEVPVPASRSPQDVPR
ncbi:hypothetical protein BJ322DRAFT_825079 [Thelephora terrestris]|uniref:Uncharacterized protein n=1 Tax=Thelephora terrestris TaxID=56493 RepID=A0A9P6HH97_9AGAM|nr:hypothetical protein BJ322DRAFT_825079 [Thelephora terrestris]